ncbi:MAG: hypothetical protein IT337_14480 [Thermomicrobiales bacterium]|nr:hypothetical protein [Thermomicrobiales bacterium]
MPARVLIAVVGAIVLIAVGAAFLLPRGADETGGAASPPAVAAAGGNDGTPAPVAAAAPAAGAPAPAVAPVPAVDPALTADVAAFATARTAATSEIDDGVALLDVAAEENRLTFTFRAGITAAEYDLVAERDVLFPGLEAFACDDGACFEVTPAAVEAACADTTLAALLQRGAVVRYRYVDLADEDLGDVTFAEANCGP